MRPAAAVVDGQHRRRRCIGSCDRSSAPPQQRQDVRALRGRVARSTCAPARGGRAAGVVECGRTPPSFVASASPSTSSEASISARTGLSSVVVDRLVDLQRRDPHRQHALAAPHEEHRRPRAAPGGRARCRRSSPRTRSRAGYSRSSIAAISGATPYCSSRRGRPAASRSAKSRRIWTEKLSFSAPLDGVGARLAGRRRGGARGRALDAAAALPRLDGDACARATRG